MSLIHLLRHGDIESDGLRRFLGQTDVSLSPLGREQAQRWRKAFAGKQFEIIYSSDLSRCVETARIIASDTGVEIQYLPELREIHLGMLEGLAFADVQNRLRKEWETRGRDIAGYTPEGGESFRDLSRRVVPVIDRIAGQHAGNVLIVTHAGVNRMVLCHALGMPLCNLFRIEQSYGCLNLLERKKGIYRVMGVNRCASP